MLRPEAVLKAGFDAIDCDENIDSAVPECAGLQGPRGAGREILSPSGKVSPVGEVCFRSVDEATGIMSPSSNSSASITEYCAGAAFLFLVLLLALP